MFISGHFCSRWVYSSARMVYGARQHSREPLYTFRKRMRGFLNKHHTSLVLAEHGLGHNVGACLTGYKEWTFCPVSSYAYILGLCTHRDGNPVYSVTRWFCFGLDCFVVAVCFYLGGAVLNRGHISCFSPGVIDHNQGKF